MEELKITEIRCLHCNKWFRSPVHYGNIEAIKTGTLKLKAPCKHCHQTTEYSIKNLRSTGENEGFIGKDT